MPCHSLASRVKELRSRNITDHVFISNEATDLSVLFCSLSLEYSSFRKPSCTNQTKYWWQIFPAPATPGIDRKSQHSLYVAIETVTTCPNKQKESHSKSIQDNYEISIFYRHSCISKRRNSNLSFTSVFACLFVSRFWKYFSKDFQTNFSLPALKLRHQNNFYITADDLRLIHFDQDLNWGFPRELGYVKHLRSSEKRICTISWRFS